MVPRIRTGAVYRRLVNRACGAVMGREDDAYDRWRDEKPFEHAQFHNQIRDGEIKIGDPFLVPGKGRGVVGNFFGYREDGKDKTFVTVTLDSGGKCCIEVVIHNVSRRKPS